MNPKAHFLCRCFMAVLALGMSACGSLNVEMQVLNPGVVRAFLDNELLTRLLPQVVASTPESLRNQVDRLEDQHRAAYEVLAQSYRREAESLTGNKKEVLTVLADSLVPKFNTNKSQKAFYESLRRDLVGYSEATRALPGARSGVAYGQPGYEPVLYQLRLWQQRVSQAQTVIAQEIRATGAPPPNVLPGGTANASLQNVIAGFQALAQTELSQLSIQNSPAAYVVAKADDERDWATRYNQVLTRSYGGASDVAIRLDGRTGNYMLKGLSFDPADVAAVAAKVSTQALLLTAQAAGVPVKTSSSPADGTTGKALATSSGALADAQAALETARSRDQSRRAALLALANTIVSEEADLGGSDGARRASMTTIRAALDARLPLIRPATP